MVDIYVEITYISSIKIRERHGVMYKLHRLILKESTRRTRTQYRYFNIYCNSKRIGIIVRLNSSLFEVRMPTDIKYIHHGWIYRRAKKLDTAINLARQEYTKYINIKYNRYRRLLKITD